ncbi:hypothetical protein [Streptomyces sp. R08]|uniref:Tetratricopeptide repeat protein n=1 Tax=Streptomyces sp. R08 TaxID=3238624 RepID=A0AB39M3G9_9ACTN
MAHLEVYISDDGLAEVAGEPLVPAPGQSVHEAVLDRLQRYAEERDAAVEATVNDGPSTAHFVLEVFPDGSSHILHPEETPAPEPETHATDTPPPPDTAVATAVARARAAAAARTAATTTDGLPVEFTRRIARINALAAADRLDEAFAEATALRESLTGSVGVEHPDAVEARAMEAYLAHLRGDHREAIVLALGVARIRCRAGDGRASADVARAAAVWQQLDDDRAVIAHGCELLYMWGMLSLRGLLPPGHEVLAGQVRGRLEGLEGAYV